MNCPKFFKTLVSKYIAIAALPLLALFYTPIVNFTVLAFGEPVLLETRSVDPRDILRGDYVILRYEIENIENMLENAIQKSGGDAYDQRGKDFFVILERDKNGIGRLKSVSLSRPSEGLYIKGNASEWNSVDYGINAYYVPEGTGYEMENRLRGSDGVRARVDVRILRGHAVIKGLVFPDASAEETEGTQ
ncbi:MAG: GDYXXLXY domain-containing protein [Azoarcus sp.]|jgi:uncharacterized membrane-anchored protein|nr:GDYXXLXY domain-containing protein [Azoarcus sp.]